MKTLRHFIDASDFTKEELPDITDLSLRSKRRIKAGHYPPLMKSKIPGMKFAQYQREQASGGLKKAAAKEELESFMAARGLN